MKSAGSDLMVKKKASRKKAVKEPKQQDEQPKLLENPLLVDFLYQVAGEHGATVAKAILEKELTDEELAKRVGLQINLVRKILYDFYENRIAVYKRTRDESSGWYIYHWRLDPQRALEYLRDRELQLLHKLEETLEKEKNTLYFSCNDGCQKVSYDVAVESDFKCPKCGKMLREYDNSAMISSIERRVEALRKKLGVFGVPS